ncbi:MAG: PspC domain-containing protein [Betaproteobacteria bacterium]|nr:PspC domain-containing protein [Betaproteobacteria bacterium]
MEFTEQLEKLARLKEQGALTDEEFTAAKKRLIDGTAEAGPAPRAAEPGPIHRFQRSLTKRWIGGVCGGLEDISTIPAWAWRILFLLTVFLNGLGLLAYMILWIFVPQEPAPRAQAAREAAPGA